MPRFAHAGAKVLSRLTRASRSAMAPSWSPSRTRRWRGPPRRMRTKPSRGTRRSTPRPGQTSRRLAAATPRPGRSPWRPCPCRRSCSPGWIGSSSSASSASVPAVAAASPSALSAWVPPATEAVPSSSTSMSGCPSRHGDRAILAAVLHGRRLSGGRAKLRDGGGGAHQVTDHHTQHERDARDGQNHPERRGLTARCGSGRRGGVLGPVGLGHLDTSGRRDAWPWRLLPSRRPRPWQPPASRRPRPWQLPAPRRARPCRLFSARRSQPERHGFPT